MVAFCAHKEFFPSLLRPSHSTRYIGAEHAKVPFVVGINGFGFCFNRARREERIVDRSANNPVSRSPLHGLEVFGTLKRHDGEMFLNIGKEENCLLRTGAKLAGQPRHCRIDLCKAVSTTASDSFIGWSINGQTALVLRVIF